MEFAPKGAGSFAAYQHGLTAKILAPNNPVISSHAIQKFNFSTGRTN